MRKKTIVKILSILLVSIGLTKCLTSKSELEDQAVLEDVVGLKLPKYSLKKYVSDNNLNIHGDFIDTLYIEFESAPPKSLIDNINRDIKEKDSIQCSRWRKYDEHNYRFRASDADGGRVPKCRADEHDWFIELMISDNSKDAAIIYGYS